MSLLYSNMLSAYHFHHVALAYLSHCIIWLLAHVCSYALDPMVPEFEEPTEQAQVEEFTKLDLDQGKPQCITPHSLTFVLN
jgi:hypothetical protein